jgi:hypothetical protein
MINIIQSEASVFIKQIWYISVALRTRATQVLLLQQHTVRSTAELYGPVIRAVRYCVSCCCNRVLVKLVVAQLFVVAEYWVSLQCSNWPTANPFVTLILLLQDQFQHSYRLCLDLARCLLPCVTECCVCWGSIIQPVDHSRLVDFCCTLCFAYNTFRHGAIRKYHHKI